MVDAESEQFSLRWNNFHSNLTAGFHALLQGEDLVDVTLAAGGQFVQAHKIVLSVCSPYFKDLFKVNPCKHPIVILKDVGHKELVAILDFMYQGEVNVRQEDLATFLKTAEMLQIKGLTGDDSAATNTPSSVPNSSERTPPSRQPAPVASVLEPLVVQSEETPIRPYKRMRAEVPAPQPPSLPPTKPPSSSSHSVSSPCTVNEDTSGIDFVEITKPKEEPVEYESDIEEVDSKVPSREDSLVQLLAGGESSSQSHQETSQEMVYEEKNAALKMENAKRSFVLTHGNNYEENTHIKYDFTADPNVLKNVMQTESREEDSMNASTSRSIAETGLGNINCSKFPWQCNFNFGEALRNKILSEQWLLENEDSNS